MNTKIQQRRATLFVMPQINLTEEVLPKYISEFSNLGLLPSINKGLGIKFTPQGIEPEEVISLDLKILDDTLKVSFGPDRVDIVSTKEGETWDSFRNTAMKISGVLRNSMNLRINRLALCASVSFRLEQGKGNIAYGRLTSTDEKPVEWQIRKVVRSAIKNPDNIEAIINEVSTVNRNDIIINGQNLGDVLNIEFDINTLVGSSVDTINIIEELFWVSSASQIENSISSYKTIFNSWQ